MFFKSLKFDKVFGKQILQTEYDVMNNNRILKLSFSEKTTKNSHNNLPQGFDICSVNVKTMRKIEQIFVAFSEKLNFTKIILASTAFSVPKNLETWKNQLSYFNRP